MWKANQLHQESKVYNDPNIDNIGGLLDEGVQKARIAHLLTPDNEEILLNYLRLQLRTSPSEAIINWSNMLKEKSNLELRDELFEQSFAILQDSKLSLGQRKIGGEIAFREANNLLLQNTWASDPNNKIKYCELLAELGQQKLAQRKVIELLDSYPNFPDGIFLLTRLSVHLEDNSKLIDLGRKLAFLATRQNATGINAIRHMTLLHLLQNLSRESLDKCIQLLSSNPQSKPIDFMRIYAIKYGETNTIDQKEQTVASCASLFDLDQTKDLLIFSRWLARLRAYDSLIRFLPFEKANVELELFKLRVDALVKKGNFERIHREIAQATLIPSKWRMIMESRAFSLSGNYEDAIKVLDRIIPLLESDPREFENFCQYLESIGDLKSLCHILEYFANKPTHAKFSLNKLIQHRAGSAKATILTNWLRKLSDISPNEINLNIAITYLEILDPDLVCPSQKLDKLLSEAQIQVDKTNLPQAKISLALAHLRNNSPDLSLVVLGNEHNWRLWSESRPAWAFIVSQVYRLNHETEKALIISENIDFKNMDVAEKDSLQRLFPNHFKI